MVSVNDKDRKADVHIFVAIVWRIVGNFEIYRFISENMFL